MDNGKVSLNVTHIESTSYGVEGSYFECNQLLVTISLSHTIWIIPRMPSFLSVVSPDIAPPYAPKQMKTSFVDPQTYKQKVLIAQKVPDMGDAMEYGADGFKVSLSPPLNQILNSSAPGRQG
jgi:hypothetical protein